MSYKEINESEIQFVIDFKNDDKGTTTLGSDVIRNYLKTNPKAIGFLTCCFLRSCCKITGDSLEECNFIASKAVDEFYEMTDANTNPTTKSE